MCCDGKFKLQKQRYQLRTSHFTYLNLNVNKNISAIAGPHPKLNLPWYPADRPDGPKMVKVSEVFVAVMACPPNLCSITTVIIVQDHNFPL